MKQKNSAAVIGSGIAGIASALRLAAKGYDVTTYEQASMPGGKISEFHKDGFRFDTGPSLFTLPNLVDELFELFGLQAANHFEYQKLESSCKYFWEDGTIINAWQQKEKFAKELEQNAGIPAKKLYGFLEKSKKLYDITSDIFIFNSLHRWDNIISRSFLKSLFQLHELDAFTTMHKKNQKWFSHPRITQLFDRYATYNGSNPYQTPATLNIIAHLEHNIGAFFPTKGMYSIVNSLVELAEKQGVKFIYNTPVEQIIVENKKIKALKTSKHVIPYEVVVSNIDVVNLYKNLLPTEKIPPNQITCQRSSSALIFYWGINHSFPQLEVHNILFSKDYEVEFKHLFSTKTIADDPTVYIFISSKIVKEDAPTNKQNWYVMINTPENTGQNWDELIAQAREKIIRKIKDTLDIDIKEYILFEKCTSPVTIEQDTGSYKGSLYGPSSNGPFSAFLRHANFRRKYKNLYFTGGSVHPGGGIPLCLASAKIVGQSIGAIEKTD